MNWIFEHREFVWGMLAGASLMLAPAVMLIMLSLHAYVMGDHQPAVRYDPWCEMRCEQCGQVFSALRYRHDAECPICVNGRSVRA